MPRRALASIYVALLMLLVPTGGVGQGRAWIYSADAEKIFGDGLAAYRAERYDQALDRLQRLLEFPLNQRSSAGQLLQGKALFRLGRFAEALDTARGLQRKFADSRYLPDARLLAGDAFFKLKRYYEAATEYGRLLATAAPLGIQAQAAERLAAIAQNGFINDQGLENLSLAVGAGRLREALFFGRARWFQRLGDDAVMSRILGAGFLAPSALVLIENPSVGTDLAGLIRLLCWFVSVKSLMFCWRPSWHTHLRQRLFANTAWRLVSALAMIAWGVIFVAAGIRIQGD